MIVTTEASFTRPADTTAYAANDLVANDVDAADVRPLTFSTGALGRGRGTIKRVRLHKTDGSDVANANFTLHLFTPASAAEDTYPAVTNGDNGAFAIDTAAHYLGSVAVDLSSGAVVGTAGAAKFAAPSPEIHFDLTKINSMERRLFGYLVAGAAYSPASGEVFSVRLDLSAED